MVLNDQEEKGMTEDEMAHHQLNERGFENTLGCSEGQGSLTSCSPWGLKSSGVTATKQQWMCSFLSGKTIFPSCVKYS